jgi:predicted acetyltransferase
MASRAVVRTVELSELRPWLSAMNATFLMDPVVHADEQQIATWVRDWDPKRIFGGYADGRCVATLRTFGTTLTVPTGTDTTAEVRADALTQVSVAATHRRQGLLTAMLSRSLADARERGEVLSVLRAAEWPIYGRFGYWPASWEATYQVAVPAALTPRAAAAAAGVDVVQVEPPDQVAAGSEILAQVRRRQPGHIDRTEALWEGQLGLSGPNRGAVKQSVCLQARDAAGRLAGYAVWRSEGTSWFEGTTEIQLTGLLATTAASYRALWRYFLQMDLVRTVRAPGRPVDEGLGWLVTDGRAVQQVSRMDDVWIRLLDVPAALGARRYAVTDSLVLDVVDTDGAGYGAGRVRLDAGPEHAECTRTPAASADLRLSQRALAGLYLSGNSVRSLQLAELVDEETPGALARLQAMLQRAAAPWNATPF